MKSTLSTKVGPRGTVGDLLRASLRGALGRMDEADPLAWRGDGKGIHLLRTTTRRLRSELRLLRDMLDPGWREVLEAELKWLASTLGGVRDIDILTSRL